MATPTTPELLDRLPPQSLDAEKAVLGSLLLDPGRSDEVASRLKPEDFYADANRRIYAHLLAMRDAGGQIDAMLLLDRLRASGEAEAVGGAAYLAEVAHAVPIAANAAYYATIVHEKARRRRVIHAAMGMLQSAWDEGVAIDDVIGDCEALLSKIPTGEFTGEPVAFSRAVVDACLLVDRICQRTTTAGMMTGIPSFDIAAGGLFPGELALLAARTSIGKTALALQVAQHVAGHGKAVYLGSLEMRTTELALRVLCGQSGVSLARVRAAEIMPADLVDLTTASAALSGLPIYLHDRPGMTMQDIRRACRRLSSRVELSLVVIDYLQRVTPADRRAQRHLQIGQIAWDAKQLALELRVPVLCLCQLSRAAEERDRKTGMVREPRLADLKESGDLEQDADMVLLLHRQPRGRDATLILAKNRQGEQGKFDLKFDAERMRFMCASATGGW